MSSYKNLIVKFVVAIRAVLISTFLGVLALGCSSSGENVAIPSAPMTYSSHAVSADPGVNAILVKSCYSCHSAEGTAPWYAAISPTYLAGNSARSALNFSDWEKYDSQRKAAALKRIQQAVSSGSMPPGDYTALDHSARLSDDDKRDLLNWASQTATAAH
jgi:uncharacterized membrane protein